ncbi:DUF3828 domain-containing protein [Proteus mirabilis]|uniref:DUF3828 domain-containing protein n=1 Tax=Proteus mirabilis TaxID=584 RepID=UPI0018C7EDAA|nr:DUF3828 domain-containing protein [Proteus mirabilis]MBG5974953.1 DUF3828 domain-containing protein [Proteus mirabilis]MDM3706084.1 DUF3828 domain-containing protein [Proteus mirabilis]MDM3721947.1 DUF3828 domain-containing protein [Proteus mirabilis]HCT1988697.1 DUF3828 domain-containing protein [Proteus mirabilis]HCT9438730.1 DUF3828 domain-containing protein [Proteus mirabilis]
MKVLTLLICLFFSSLLLALGKGNATPETTVLNFYAEYLLENNDDIQAELKKNEKAMLMYVSPNLINELKKEYLNADYFVDAQYFCPDWVSNIKVNNVKVNNKKATLRLELGALPNISKYSIALKYYNEEWKIISVKPDNNNSPYCNELRSIK